MRHGTMVFFVVTKDKRLEFSRGTLDNFHLLACVMPVNIKKEKVNILMSPSNILLCYYILWKICSICQHPFGKEVLIVITVLRKKFILLKTELLSIYTSLIDNEVIYLLIFECFASAEKMSNFVLNEYGTL